MTTITEHRGTADRRLVANTGFTLTEIIVATGLGGILLAAMLTTFVFIAKGGARLAQFHDLETRSSLALQQFAMDARQAETSTWVNTNQLSLQVTGKGAVNYTYDTARRTLKRTTATETRTLASDINSFQFAAFDRDGAALRLDADDINAKTKMVQMEITFRSGGGATKPVESTAVSARCMLRNKSHTDS